MPEQQVPALCCDSDGCGLCEWAPAPQDFLPVTRAPDSGKQPESLLELLPPPPARHGTCLPLLGAGTVGKDSEHSSPGMKDGNTPFLAFGGMQDATLTAYPLTTDPGIPTTQHSAPSGAELLTTSPTSAFLSLSCCLFHFLLLYSSEVLLLTMPPSLARHPFSLCHYTSTLIPLSQALSPVLFEFWPVLPYLGRAL